MRSITANYMERYDSPHDCGSKRNHVIPGL
jgi:hypothetical protein